MSYDKKGDEDDEATRPQVSLPLAPLIVVLTLATFLAVVYLIAVIWPLADPDARPPPVHPYYNGSSIVGLVFTLLLTLMLAVCFYLAASTDPGGVPRVFPFDPSKTEAHLERASPSNASSADLASAATMGALEAPLTLEDRGYERKMDGGHRYCKYCETYKPDRTHHCAKLGKCVLEMDHWCAWIRNTIGFANKKYFLLLLMYAWLTLAVYCITLGPYLPGAARLVDGMDILTILCWVLAAAEFLIIFPFWCFHIYFVCAAWTTIEYREKRRANDSKRTAYGWRVNELYKSSPYDRGVRENWIHIFGPNPMLWFVPTTYGMPRGLRAGTVYRVKSNHALARAASQAEERPLTPEGHLAVGAGEPQEEDEEDLDDERELLLSKV